MASDAVNQIKERLSIVDVIAPYVELHQAGRHFKGKSPFTSEKTPSFYVSPDRGMYYCFSSSQGGDMFTFVQTIEGVDFKGALKILAEKAGVELVPEDPKVRSERETGYVILAAAAAFFEEKRRSRSDIDQYLRDRGVTETTVQKWQIGYAPGPPQGGWRELRSYLNEKGYTDQQLLAAGLVKAADSGKEPYDVFRDRVMFPIFDPSGRVVAFSGRIFEKDSEAPKYVNSPETTFFNKSEILYGYDKAKQGIRQYDFSLIVEGQFDVVLSHQAGYTNTVAVSGTALTSHHVGLLQRLSNRVVLALDADRAGVAAVKRAADLMLARGIDLKVAALPEGKDPADIVKEDAKQLRDIISKSTHVIEFLLTHHKNTARDERTYKLQVRDEVLPYILKMQNQIDADHFVGVVAAAIDSRREAIMLELERLRENQTHHQTEAQEAVVLSKGGTVESQNRKQNLIAHLAVTTELLSAEKGTKVAEVFSGLVGKTTDEYKAMLSPERNSELLFTIEALLTDMPERQLEEYLNTQLRELELLILRDAIRAQKDLLAAAETAGEDITAYIVEGDALTQKRAAAEARNTYFD